MGKDWSGTCATGQRQSPIDISTKDAKTRCTENKEQVFKVESVNPNETEILEFHVSTSIKAYGNYGSLIATNVDFQLLGYDMDNFHIHAPSEHTIDGKLYRSEMHIVFILKPEFQKKGYE